MLCAGICDRRSAGVSCPFLGNKGLRPVAGTGPRTILMVIAGEHGLGWIDRSILVFCDPKAGFSCGSPEPLGPECSTERCSMHARADRHRSNRPSNWRHPVAHRGGSHTGKRCRVAPTLALFQSSRTEAAGSRVPPFPAAECTGDFAEHSGPSVALPGSSLLFRNGTSGQLLPRISHLIFTFHSRGKRSEQRIL